MIFVVISILLSMIGVYAIIFLSIKRSSNIEDKTKKIILRNVAPIFFSLIIIGVVIYQDISGVQLSSAYVKLPASIIIGRSIKQLIGKSDPILPTPE